MQTLLNNRSATSDQTLTKVVEQNLQNRSSYHSTKEYFTSFLKKAKKMHIPSLFDEKIGKVSSFALKGGCALVAIGAASLAGYYLFSRGVSPEILDANGTCSLAEKFSQEIKNGNANGLRFLGGIQPVEKPKALEGIFSKVWQSVENRNTNGTCSLGGRFSQEIENGNANGLCVPSGIQFQRIEKIEEALQEISLDTSKVEQERNQVPQNLEQGLQNITQEILQEILLINTLSTVLSVVGGVFWFLILKNTIEEMILRRIEKSFYKKNSQNEGLNQLNTTEIEDNQKGVKWKECVVRYMELSLSDSFSREVRTRRVSNIIANQYVLTSWWAWPSLKGLAQLQLDDCVNDARRCCRQRVIPSPEKSEQEGLVTS